MSDNIELFFNLIMFAVGVVVESDSQTIERFIMCGIYASFSFNAGQKVFEGLKRIEYRGYDSWGVATLKKSVIGKEKLELKKQVGKLSNVKSVKFPKTNLSLGHTRWATHGGVTKLNTHPHLAMNKSFALVQNGVAENYQELKNELLDNGYNFVSETDTEVIVGLLEKEMINNKENNLSQETFIKVFKRLTGRNTVAVITTSGQIMAIRNGSPLVVGRKSVGSKATSITLKIESDIYFSSDVLSMSVDADEYLTIKSGQMVVFDSISKSFTITEIKSNKKIEAKFVPIEHKLEAVSKNKLKNFMLKEIHEQASVLTNVIAPSSEDLEEKFLKAVKMIKNAGQVFTLGCGSASYAAGNTAYLLRKNSIFASAIDAYEADSYHKLFGVSRAANTNNVCIVFSQSGETADTNEVVELMKKKNVKIISVVNMPGSTLAQLSDLSFMLNVGPELAVASTKAFFGHVLWGITINDILSGIKLSYIKVKINKFEHKLKEWFSNNSIQENIRRIAKDLVVKNHVFILGRGDLYYAGLESALKLKEISYIHAEGFSGGELKHGVIALIEKNTPVLCLVAEDENKHNMLNAIAEIRARGGKTIVIARENNQLYDDWIQLPNISDYIFLSSIIPSQLMTCYMAMEKGYDVDKPRNLAKSVTVK